MPMAVFSSAATSCARTPGLLNTIGATDKTNSNVERSRIKTSLKSVFLFYSTAYTHCAGSQCGSKSKRLGGMISPHVDKWPVRRDHDSSEGLISVWRARTSWFLRAEATRSTLV